MKIKLIFMFFIFSIYMLKAIQDDEKYRFITNFINNSDSVEVYLNQCSFKKDFYLRYLNSERKSIILKKYKERNEKYYKDGFEFYLDFKRNVGFLKNGVRGKYLEHLIIIRGKENEKIEFYWEYLENGEWELTGIERITENDDDYYLRREGE